MYRLLNELLELSRIGRLINPPEKVAFIDIVNDALVLIEGQLTANNTRVIVQENMPIVHGDRLRLVEVMQNLIDNASKFSSSQPHPQIEIGATEENSNLVFFVRDNGIGINPSFHERIFNLFDKLDPKSEGTGVGLALVKRIIEVHGGKIWVESEGSGKGSTFCFTLSTG
jgi:signal transduction histidine kinase